MVELEPRAHEDQVCERQRVRLGEAEVGERQQFRVDAAGELVVDAVRVAALVEAVAQALHPGGRPFRAHRAAQFVGLGGGEATDVDGDLHELFLEQRHAVGLLQSVGQQGMVVLPLLDTVAAPDVRVHRATLDGARSDQRDLDDEVVELARLKARQRGHLRAALHLEDADRIGFLQHRRRPWRP